VPVYNAAPTFPAALDSILTQTYRDIEVLVVDNCSDDGTLEIAEVRAAADPRVKVLKSGTNIGAVPNLMRCIRLAAGKYTAIFHADDIYSPQMIEREVDFLERNPGTGAVFSMAAAIDSNGVRGKIFNLPQELRLKAAVGLDFWELFRSILRNGNFLFTPSPLVRTEVYENCIHELRQEMAGTSLDLDLWLRIAERYPVGIIDAPLLGYRMAKESFSYNHLRAKTGRHDLFKVLAHYIDKYSGRLVAEDRANYEFLLLKDDVNRAFNSFSLGDSVAARRLLSPLFSREVLVKAASSGLRLKVLFMGIATFLLTFLPLPPKARDRISRARY